MNDVGGGLVWLGYVLKTLAALALLGDGLFQLFGDRIAPGPFRKMMAMGEMRVELAKYCGLAGLVSAVLYIVPATSVMGAILATGFLGGAIAIDLRVNGFGTPSQAVSFVLGLLTWGGLYLLMPELRALIPVIQ